MKVKAGNPSTLGAHCEDGGTNFALFSANAERVELCLYDPAGKQEIGRCELPEKTHDVWHGFLPEVAPGACYGYRVHGSYDPCAGHRFNSAKLLLDPYTRALQGEFQWHPSHFAFDPDSAHQDLIPDSRDNAAFMPKGVVCPPVHRNENTRPRVPWHKTVIYETHVKGFTWLNPEIPESIRGTFTGMAQPQVIDYIKSLGMTSVELLPVQAFIDEYHLHEKGLTNYWGYNTLNFFSPQSRYLDGNDPELFRIMVDRFHEADLEVILDVVYNHTCEGNHLGPTLSFKGIDNASYYQLLPEDERFYINDSGCGNTINIRHPRVLQLVMDSMRYWVEVMGVDGFRFDLGSILGRQERGFNRESPFFQVLTQDPVLSKCKLIAEPWDLGPGGYQLGQFPPGWSEWNDRYRDTIRRFWRGDSGELPELARRLHGSADIFEHAGRRPCASINYISIHDGFTLRDLVSYKHGHNEANGEDNNEGYRENQSFNHGCEGETEDEAINDLRWRQIRNILTTLVVSQGVPMIQAGDEVGRTQLGNNNSYCQDNAINWIDWSEISKQGSELRDFTRRLLTLRECFPVLQADQYRHPSDDSNEESIQWLNREGKLMCEDDWHERNNHVLGYLLTENTTKEELETSYLLVLFNASCEDQTFVLPRLQALSQTGWKQLLDSTYSDPAKPKPVSESLEVFAKSLVVLSTGKAPTLAVPTNLEQTSTEKYDA